MKKVFIPPLALSPIKRSESFVKNEESIRRDEKMDLAINLMKKVSSSRKQFRLDSARGNTKPTTPRPMSARETFQKLSSFLQGSNEISRKIDSASFGDFGQNEVYKKFQARIEEKQTSLVNKCEEFAEHLRNEIDTSKNELEESMIFLFKKLTKERWPNIFIRSIKDYISERDLDPMVKRSLILFEKCPHKSQSAIPIDENGPRGDRLRFDEDIMRDVSAVIRQNVSKSYRLSIELISSFIQSIKEIMSEIQQHNQQAGEIIRDMESLEDEVREKTTNTLDELEKKKKVLKILEEEMEMKKIQKAILVEQFDRRKKSFESEKKEFIRELEKLRAKFIDKPISDNSFQESNDITERDSKEMIERKLKKRIERERKKIKKERKEIKNEIRNKMKELEDIEKMKKEEYDKIKSQVIIERNKRL